MKRKQYEKTLRKLQTELSRLQEWVVRQGLRMIVVFEGRDTAGKGGTIKAITERVSPRVFRVVVLPVPSDRERTQMYAQRYIPHLPAAGEVVIFDRSGYNRAGVEHVMGFCTDQEYRESLENCPRFEAFVVRSGIILIKFWLEVGQEQQQRRFEARDAMLKATDTKEAPWYIVRSDDKKRARLNCIAHLLTLIPYKAIPHKKVKLPARSNKGKYDDQATLRGRRFLPEKY